VSNDQHRRPINNDSADRSRDRWRPPDQNRERRPAGDRTADLENTTGNGNIPANNELGLSLQARRSAELRRQRRMRMAAAAWKLGPPAFFEFIDELDRHFDVRISIADWRDMRTPIRGSWHFWAATAKIGANRHPISVESGR
jgi:hypothetical protein